MLAVTNHLPFLSLLHFVLLFLSDRDLHVKLIFMFSSPVTFFLYYYSQWRRIVVWGRVANLFAIILDTFAVQTVKFFRFWLFIDSIFHFSFLTGQRRPCAEQAKSQKVPGEFFSQMLHIWNTKPTTLKPHQTIMYIFNDHSKKFII